MVPLPDKMESIILDDATKLGINRFLLDILRKHDRLRSTLLCKEKVLSLAGFQTS